MITIKLEGGLGNQLFQIFTCISYAIKYGCVFAFPYNKNEYHSSHNKIFKRPIYWENFLIELKNFTFKSSQFRLRIFKNIFIEDKKYPNYNKNYKFKDNLRLFGFFQSHKYFENDFFKIYKLLNIEEKKNKIKNKIHFIKNSTYISLHFRIGDYKYNKNNYHNILTIEYYINSIKKILKLLNNNKKIYILCFGEKEDLDTINKNITILKNLYPFINFQLINFIDWEELLIMSLCNHNIIANSTFSWWGAYLNLNHDKIVTYPRTWNNLNFILDMFPDKWICI